MICYEDGQAMRAGDQIRFERGQTSGTIVAVIEAPDLQQHNVEEAGVMVKSAPFGLVFLAASRMNEDPVALDARGPSPSL